MTNTENLVITEFNRTFKNFLEFKIFFRIPTLEGMKIQ